MVELLIYLELIHKKKTIKIIFENTLEANLLDKNVLIAGCRNNS